MSNATRDLLEQHFDTAFAAPDGIKKLRELILTLAMQGKLVQQDPSDPPASQLLKEIAAEKRRLVKEGRIKTQKLLGRIAEDEKAFELPDGWAWTRFADFALDVSTGPFGSLIHQSDYVSGGVPLVNPSHMIDGRIVPDHSVSLSVAMAKSLDPYRLSNGDMVMARRGEVGRVALVTEVEDGWLCGTGSFVLRFTPQVSRAFVCTLFKCAAVRAYLAGAAVGTTMVNLNHGILLEMPIAIPPFPEQHRIVAKIDQLMARCDELERLRAEREQKRRSVHSAALKQLLDAQAADSIADAWQFISQHFGDLYAVKENVAELRKAVLQLAVMGKLVPQNPNDPPASQLLKEIEAERKRLVKEGKIKVPKPLPEITAEEMPYVLPNGWKWVRLGDVSLSSDAGWSPQCLPEARTGNEWGVLKVSAVSWGNFNPNENKALPSGISAKPECEVMPGDLLLSRANTDELVARSVIVGKTPMKLMMSDKIVRFSLSKSVDKLFINVANGSPSARAYYVSNASGTSSSMKGSSSNSL